MLEVLFGRAVELATGQDSSQVCLSQDQLYIVIGESLPLGGLGGSPKDQMRDCAKLTNLVPTGTGAFLLVWAATAAWFFPPWSPELHRLNDVAANRVLGKVQRAREGFRQKTW